MGFRDKWLPRLFIAAIAPSVAMLIALIFFPNSQIAKCPLFESGASLDASESVEVAGQFVMDIDGARFPIKNFNIIETPLKRGDFLILLGIVLDVRSGAMFYGSDGGYGALANGHDSTRALLLSSLKDEDMSEDIGDQPRDQNFKDKLKQWLTFFLNKYPQAGVVAGAYWTAEGEPTSLIGDLSKLLSSAVVGTNTDQKPVMDECVFSPSTESVSCESKKYSPKIHRSRGKSKCVCVDENSIFAIKSNEFVIVDFQDCDKGGICTVKDLELKNT